MIYLMVRYILEATLKDRILLGFLVLLAVIVSLSIFLGSSAITEKDQFSIVFAAGALRVGAILTIILFVVSHVRRSFETNDVDYLLSKPISRLGFLSAHFIAFSILATIIVLLVFLAIAIMPSYQIEFTGHFLWAVSLWIETIIIVFVAVFFSFILQSSVIAILSTFAFYVLARLIGGILSIIETGTNENVIYLLMNKVMLLISLIIPRLDLMGQTSWLVYGADIANNLSFILFQGVVFCSLIYIAAYIDLKRKQF